jgi:hypothetical protein
LILGSTFCRRTLGSLFHRSFGFSLISGV